MNHEITGFEHVHLHSDKSLLDGFGMVQEYASRWKGFGDYLCISDHGMMAAVPSQIKYCKASGKKDDPYKDKALKPIFACLTAGNFIITSEGAKDIKDIEVGDYVLTHKGRFRKVLRTMSRICSEPLYKIKLAGSNKKWLTITGEHPILIRDIKGNVNWIEVKNIITGRPTTQKGLKHHNSYVCFPKQTNLGKSTINISGYLT